MIGIRKTKPRGVLAFVLLLAGTAPCLAAYKTLSVPMLYQTQTYWCWNAVDQMALQYYWVFYSQPELAEIAFHGNSGCCCSPANCITNPASCNLPCHPQIAFYSPYVSYRVGDLTWDEAKGQINSGYPFIFSWNWSGGGTHYRIAKGWLDSYGSRWILQNDPVYGESWVTKSDYEYYSNSVWYNIH